MPNSTRSGLYRLDAVLALKREFRDVIDIQVVAFPQEGILKSPGTDAMMVQAMAKGADVVGAIPYNDSDAREHIAVGLRAGARTRQGPDFHQDSADARWMSSRKWRARPTSLRVRRAGQRRPPHALGAVEPQRRDEIIALLRDAGISVMCCRRRTCMLGGRRTAAMSAAPYSRCGPCGTAASTYASRPNKSAMRSRPSATATVPGRAVLACLPATWAAPTISHRAAHAAQKSARALRLPDYGIVVGRRGGLRAARHPFGGAARSSTLPVRKFVVKRGRVVRDRNARPSSASNAA
jgi:cytosine deaminase